MLQQLEPPAKPPAAFYQRLDASSEDVAAMRAAVREAAEQQAPGGVSPGGGGGGGLSLHTLSLLAERGLSLLGLAFPPLTAPQSERSPSPEPSTAPADVAADALAQAQQGLHAMHAHLESRLGAGCLREATARVLANIPAEHDDETRHQWESTTLRSLAAFLRRGAWQSATPPSPPSPPSSPPALAEEDSETLARAVVALALWSRAVDTAGGGHAAASRAALTSLHGVPHTQDELSSLRGQAVSVRGPWVEMLVGPSRAPFSLAP